ncbi:hypothetical protein B0H14DRAFT_3487258 [Mycena olivaceomarginata]|nr:hypothetical protein B0H14DRAFT_3487258 [Mycena olivaceomarginata]
MTLCLHILTDLPSSRHSSSSAIFERDIEPVLHLSSPALPNATSPARPKDPHRTARSKNTEALEQSVPSVLDSAAAVLASLGPSLEDGDAVAVTAPAPHPPSSSASALFGDQGLGGGTVRSRSTGTGSGFVSPIGSFRSRSPSPSPRSGAGAGAGAGNRNSLLLNIPSPAGAPTPATSPASASASASSAPPTARQFDSAPPEHAAPRTPAASVNKRLSFVSYADLLSCTPTATQPLSALTSPAGSPAHITGVDPAFAPSPGGASAGGSGAPSLRNFIFGGAGAAGAGGEEDRMMDDVGGEWEREGLGRGLEERLEALAGIGMSACSPLLASAIIFGTAGTPRIPQHAPQFDVHSASTMTSTASNSSSYSLSPLPSPVSPTSLTVETPSLGDALLPRPKRGAPQVAPASKKPEAEGKDKKKKDKKKKDTAPLDPALCEGW